MWRELGLGFRVWSFPLLAFGFLPRPNPLQFRLEVAQSFVRL